MKKVVFLGVIALVISAAAYFAIIEPIIDSIYGDNNKATIHLYIFGNEQQWNNHEKNAVLANFDNELDEHKIIIHSANNTGGDELIIKKVGGLTNENAYKNYFNKKIDSLAKAAGKYAKVNSISANSLIEQYINTLSNTKDKNESIKIVWLGTFPVGYSDNDVQKLNINTKLKKSEYKNIEFNWTLRTCDEEPEYKLIKTFESKGIRVLNNTIVTPKRPDSIEKPLKPIYAIMLNKLDIQQSKELEMYLRMNYGQNLKLTLWNDGIKNNSIVQFTDSKPSNDSTLSIFSQLDRAKWTSFGYLIKQAVNNLQQSKLFQKTPLLLVGNMPAEGRGTQLNKDTWDLLKTMKNIELVLYMPSGSKMNELDKLLRFGLDNLKINYINK